jgi:hypothetical protein
MPPKTNLNQSHIEKPPLSSRGYEKENDLAKERSNTSFKIQYPDNEPYDTNPNTARGHHHNHPKTMTVLPPNFGGNYQFEHGSKSPITANTTQNNIHLEGTLSNLVNNF